jgi:hypothetical protein
MRYVRHFPISTLLFSIFPVLSLLSYNIDQIRWTETIRSFVIASLGSVILVLIYKLILKDWNTATLVGSFSVLLFFSYGHVYGLLKQVSLFNFLIGRHRYLIPLWLLIFLFGSYLIIERLKEPQKYVQVMNYVAAISVVIPLINIVSFEIRFQHAQTQSQETSPGKCELSLPAEGQAPDIYYIILDAYAREDTLMDVYHYDNSSFLDYLKKKGFYIANWSQSNYMFTFLSLASSLNMNYLDQLDERITPGATFDRTPIHPLLGQSLVRKNLECLGYKIVTLDSGFYITGWLNADVYISADTSAYEAIELSGGITAFESMLLRNSAFAIFIDATSILPKFLQVDTSTPFKQYYYRAAFLLDALEQIVPSIEGPKFVFGHVLVTHKPYTFGPNGELLEAEGQFTLKATDDETDFEQEAALYRGSVTYLNKRLVKIIDEIIESSETPPIIILQSDHGPLYNDNRLDIINVYYLPQCSDQPLYATISPVNSFRIVFNCALGGNYDLIEDLSYASPYESFDFRLVPNPHATN